MPTLQLSGSRFERFMITWCNRVSQWSVGDTFGSLTTPLTTRPRTSARLRCSVRECRTTRSATTKISRQITQQTACCKEIKSTQDLSCGGGDKVSAVLLVCDAVRYTYQTGQEYLGIFPVWDWSRLPGTTNRAGVLGTKVRQQVTSGR